MIDPNRKVYVTTCKKDEPKMHLKHDCSCLIKNGTEVPRHYVTQQEAISIHGALEFCKRCIKPKSRKGKRSSF